MDRLSGMAETAIQPERGFKRCVLRFAHGVDGVVAVVCQIMIVFTTVVLLALLGVNVAVRYIFSEGGIAWISEVPAQLFPWLIAAGIVMATLRGGHIAVDFAFSILGERAAQCLAVAIQALLVAAYAALFIVAGDVAEIVAIERSPLLNISGSWGYYALMFASAGVALCSLNILLRVLLEGRAGLPRAGSEESPI